MLPNGYQIIDLTVNLPISDLLREAAKKVFFSGPATKRGGGGYGLDH